MTLLTVDEFKEHVTTSLGDDALQRLLDAAENAITVEAGGPPGDITELFDGGEQMLVLSHRAEEITKITETIFDDSIELDDTDFRLGRDLVSITRLDTGAHPSRLWGDRRRLWGAQFIDRLEIGRWSGLVRVEYTPVDDTPERIRVQIELVKLDLNRNPGLASETIGSWQESYATDPEFFARREDILRSLHPDTWWFA